MIKPGSNLLQNALNDFQGALTKTLSLVTGEELSSNILSTDLLKGSQFFPHNSSPYDIQHIASSDFDDGFYFIQDPQLVFGMLDQQMGRLDRPFTSIMGKKLTSIEKQLNLEIYREVHKDFRNIFNIHFDIGNYRTTYGPVSEYSIDIDFDDPTNDPDTITVTTIEITAKHYNGTFMLVLPYSASTLLKKQVAHMTIPEENPQTIACLLPRLEKDKALLAFNALADGMKAEVLFRVYESGDRKILPIAQRLLNQTYILSDAAVDHKAFVKEFVNTLTSEQRDSVVSKLKEKDPEIDL